MNVFDILKPFDRVAILHMRHRLIHILKEHFFLIGIAIVILLGLYFPSIGLKAKTWRCDLWVVMVMMFLSGVTLATRDLFRQSRNFRAIGLSFGIVYVLAPALAFFFASIFFPNDQDLLIGFMVLGAQSSTLVSGFVLSGLAGGDSALALVISVFNNTVSVFATPVILSAALSLKSDIELNVWEMMLRIGMVVLSPFCAGQIVRRSVLRWMTQIRPVAVVVSQLCVLIMMLAGISQGATRLHEAPMMIVELIVSLTGLHLILNFISFQSGKLIRLDEASRISIGVCSAQKTLPTGFYIANSFFPGVPLAAFPLVLYHVCQLVIDSVQSSWLARRSSRQNKMDASFSPE